MSTTPPGNPTPSAKSPEELNREIRARVAAASPAPAEPKRESLRDTVESIVFALILAFLFRTFEAEAFVIPTGSMAPTLYGRHKETNCTKCGAHIVVGASDEFNAEVGALFEGCRLVGALCPNCRYENKQLKDALAFNGDRILVNKFPYEIGEPNRWDVFVFKYPQEPDVNYIKRLVGLPGETIRIRQGDLYQWNGKTEQILRKPDPAKQRALQMLVYDDNHAPTELIAGGWPERWAAVAQEPNGEWKPTATTWEHAQEQRIFRLNGEDLKEPAWLRYRHYNSRPRDWEALEKNQPIEPRLELITDFCGYNAVWGEGSGPYIDIKSVDEIDEGAFWVGDLTLNVTAELSSIQTGGELILELAEGIYLYRCRIDLTSGVAKLSEFNQGLGTERPMAEAHTAMSTEGKYEISYANVDDRLCLWINNTLVPFGESADFKRDGGTGVSLPQKSDLSPAGLALRGASGIVRDLVIQRDVYYRAATHQTDSLQRSLTDLVDDPDAYREEYRKRSQYDQRELKVADEGYLAFGDNSPRSKDSRLWGEPESVDRKLLVGRAFYVYWPHGVPFLNEGRGFQLWPHKEAVVDQRKTPRGEVETFINYKSVEGYPKYTVPFYPQVDRMKRIR